MKFLYQRGLNPAERAMPEEPLKIYREGEYVCSVMPGGEVHCKEQSDDVTAVTNFIEDNYKNYIWCECLPRMPFDGVNDYTKFYEVGNSVLAAKIMPNDTIEYVTWEYGYDRKGVMWGHYFGEDFAAAKQDFAVRAGLIDKQRLFSNEEITALHDACVFCLMNDEDLTAKGVSELHSLIRTFEQLYPPLAEEPETENEDENELSEEVDL